MISTILTLLCLVFKSRDRITILADILGSVKDEEMSRRGAKIMQSTI